MATTAPASAQADRIKLIYAEEVAYGTREPTGPYKELRFTSESLQKTTEFVVSSEIRSDRQNADVIRTSIGAGGDLNFELSYATFDDYFRWALMSSEATPPGPEQVWSGLVVVAGPLSDVAGVAATDEFTSVAFTAMPANNTWIKVSGFTGAGVIVNNSIFKVLSQTASTSIVVYQTGVIADDAAGEAITITGASQIVNGTTFWSHSLQKEYTDMSGPAIFEDFTSLSVNTWALNVPVDGIVTGTFGMIGKTSASSVTIYDAGADPANTNEVMAAVEDVLKIEELNAEYGSMAFTMNLNNNLRQRQEIGTLGAISVGAGSLDLTGNVQAYFKNVAAMDRYLNFTSSNIAIIFQDSVGNNYVIDIPEVKYTDGKRVAGGRNTDIIADLSWTAKRDPTEGITIRMAKFTA